MTAAVLVLLALAAVADPAVHLAALSVAYGTRRRRRPAGWDLTTQWRRWHRWRHTNRPAHRDRGGA